MCLNPMTKTSIPIEKENNQKQHKTLPETSIKQQLRTDVGRSAGETTTIQLVWLNRAKGVLTSPLAAKAV